MILYSRLDSIILTLAVVMFLLAFRTVNKKGLEKLKDQTGKKPLRYVLVQTIILISIILGVFLILTGAMSYFSIYNVGVSGWQAIEYVFILFMIASVTQYVSEKLDERSIKDSKKPGT